LPSSATSVRNEAYAKGALVSPRPRHAFTHWCQWLTAVPGGTFTSLNLSAGRSTGGLYGLASSAPFSPRNRHAFGSTWPAASSSSSAFGDLPPSCHVKSSGPRVVSAVGANV